MRRAVTGVGPPSPRSFDGGRRAGVLAIALATLAVGAASTSLASAATVANQDDPVARPGRKIARRAPWSVSCARQ